MSEHKYILSILSNLDGVTEVGINASTEIPFFRFDDVDINYGWAAFDDGATFLLSLDTDCPGLSASESKRVAQSHRPIYGGFALRSDDAGSEQLYAYADCLVTGDLKVDKKLVGDLILMLLSSAEELDG